LCPRLEGYERMKREGGGRGGQVEKGGGLTSSGRGFGGVTEEGEVVKKGKNLL